MVTFLTHFITASFAFVGGYLWCLRAWNQWEPRRETFAQHYEDKGPKP